MIEIKDDNVKRGRIMAKFICPFCLREYNKNEVLYWCSNCNSNKNVIKPKIPFGKTICNACGSVANVRKCKNIICDAGPDGVDVIPKDALETPYLPFCIVGLSNSGKTNLITVMLHELQHNPDLHLAAGALNRTSNSIQNEHYEMIYHKHFKPDATIPNKEKPQIWKVKNVAKSTGHKVPTYTFTIYDGAGESHQRLEPGSTECNYIAASKAIIVTIDPLALECVKNGGVVDTETINNSRPIRYADGNEGLQSAAVVNSVADYIRTSKGISGKMLLTMPVALVLTKFDTILGHPYFGENALVKHRSNVFENGEYHETEALQIDSEIQNWLVEIGEGAFINAIKANFNNFCFFGVSSYGSAPPNDVNTPNTIVPHRVLDPFFWLFHQVGYI